MAKHDSAALAIAPEPALKERKKKPIQWDGEVDLVTLILPNMMAMTGSFGTGIGQDFNGGGSLSGLVRRITLMPSGVIRVIIEKAASNRSGSTGDFGAFVFFGNGMYAEIDRFEHEPITEENSGPWQQSMAVHR